MTASVHGPVDVVCLGESMVTFLPTRAGRLADVPSYLRGIGGAETNVACALAAAGHRTRWVGRVGADGFGEYLVEAIGAYGVDTSAVARDPSRPTGVYFRTATDRATDAHEVVYYRAGSAASAMSPAIVPYDALWSGRVLHVSGITAALSPDCLALMRDLTARREDRPLVSFDVNHRPGLWRDPAAARVLLDLARGADVVFVGEDEAEEAWGLRGPDAVREALPEPAVLVVKRGAAGAVSFTTTTTTTSTSTTGTGDAVARAPAPRVTVTAPVGAGDAFAAGFLAATLRGLGGRERLRHGHLWAAAALTVPGDLAPPPAAAHADRLVALDDDAWGRLHLGPGWTGNGDDQEVRTP
ncbi:sugar kinase [Streptomyces peucetius]|uniref:Sugar kinase n=1 Tax=Streptomyces peucetius TaxID=1950 RepID=A0ABY6IAU7_STRPE|nr:sugar kinase [Streptomyces peucetius]UYQ64122.1 sugar kinase [Streptomyces peucetius]